MCERLMNAAGFLITVSAVRVMRGPVVVMMGHSIFPRVEMTRGMRMDMTRMKVRVSFGTIFVCRGLSCMAVSPGRECRWIADQQDRQKESQNEFGNSHETAHKSLPVH